jgi:hypothetical protein
VKRKSFIVVRRTFNFKFVLLFAKSGYLQKKYIKDVIYCNVTFPYIIKEA